jgi:hypothetical protein
MRFKSLLFFILLAPSLSLVAATETATPTATRTDSPTPSPTRTWTATPTPTPGPGKWSLSLANPLVFGVPGASAVWTYTTGANFLNGLLIFSIPAGLEDPQSATFFIQPSQSALVGAPSFNGQTVSFPVNNVPAGTPMVFYYGYKPGGFAVTSTVGALGPFGVWASPLGPPQTPAPVTPHPAPPTVYVVTATSTATPTPTATETTTYTVTPTISPTHTITQTFTETPLGAEPAAGGLYAYPNPFDLRRFNKVTFRFKPAASAEVEIFNLLGEPVRRLEAADIQAPQGWALWRGEDDRLLTVVGGLYFVRVKTPAGVLVRKFTVLR